MKILYGCPVRNRAWCLARSMSAARDDVRDATGRAEPGGFYLYNDCVDATESTLAMASRWNVHSEQYNTGFEGWTRRGKAGPRRDEANMAVVFNEWMQRSLQFRYDYLYLVSSDIVPAIGTLKKLLDCAEANPGDVVGAVCYNSEGGSMNWMFRRGEDGDSFYRPLDGGEWLVRIGDPFQVDLIGSPLLIPRDVVRGPARHGAHPQTHLAQWCTELIWSGTGIWAVPDVRVEHWMGMDRKLLYDRGQPVERL